MINKRDFSLILVLLLRFFAAGLCEEIDIDISGYNPADENTHFFHILLDKIDENATEIIVRNNATNHSGFYIVQAHSYRYNVSLSHFGDVQQNVTGCNIGILQFFKESFINTFILQKSSNNSVKALIAVTVYELGTPIPGGCSNVKSNNVVPSLEVIGGPNIISVKSEVASVEGISCNASKVQVVIKIYHKYLSSQNFKPYEYFNGILTMLTVKDVSDSQSGSRLVSVSNGTDSYKKLFSSYIGVGEVFVVLATFKGKTSAYVPAVSYGEDINLLLKREENGEQGLFVTLFSMLPFVSLLIICKGHQFFHFTTFSLGLSCGTIVSFFIMNKDGASTLDEKLLWSVLFGILYGFTWVVIWYKCGIPLLSATLAFLHTGALIVSIIYYCGLADLATFHNDGTYWSVFLGLMLMFWFLLSVFTMHGHIFSCAFLGSYILMITTLNYWMGANLQYVVINVYRRIFVKDFNEAILDAPYQAKDIFIVFVGLLFLLRGYHVQVKNQRGKPPFPPHRSHGVNDERSPLLFSA